ncbi:FHA domain-containing protein [Actinomyces sp. HMT897]|uniref:FHA domain-containing protein n=1 Tax=Actinomyces sp. HMT897 TaxID=2789424 RepID=UPI00190B21E5|nr:FHA domain-containing protein [Actinomyces sp. HMT897]QQO77415.1 RDD family protein [Actinomyces sp. HMT897]
MSPASATSRLLALLVDALVLLAAGLVGWALLDSQVLAAMTAVEALAVLTLVRAVTGRSPGALATRTAMVRAGTQTAPGLWPALARQALLVALGLTVLGPVVTVALSRDGRDWVDRLLGTGAVDLRERHDPTPQEVLVNIPTSQGVPEPQASPALAWQGPSHPGRPVGPGSLVGLGSPVGEGGLAGLGPGRAGPEQTGPGQVGFPTGPGQVGPGPEPDWASPRTAPVAPSHPGPAASRPDPAARPFLPEPVVPLSPTPGGLPSPVPQPLSPTPPAPPTRPEAAASPEPVPDEEPAPTVGPAPVVGPEPDVPPAAPAPQDPAAQLPAETPPAPAARQPGPVRPPQLAPVAPSLPEPVEQPTPVLQPLPLVSAPSSASPAAPAPGTPDDAPSEPEQAPPASGTPDDAPDLAQTPDDDADVPADHDVALEPEQAPLHDQEHSAPSPQDPPPTREPSPDPAPPLDPAPAPISGSSPAAAPLAAQEPREEPDADQAHRPPAQAPTQAGPIPYLVVDSGERLPVDGTVLVLGRAPSTSEPGQRLVTLSDPTRSLSRTHLRVGCSKHGVWVEDAFSANGTHVRMRDGASYFLPRGERVEVPFGTVLLLGERRLTITTDLPRNQ